MTARYSYLKGIGTKCCFGFEAQKPFEEGLSKAIEWYRAKARPALQQAYLTTA